MGPRRNRVRLRRGRSTLGLVMSLLVGLALLFALALLGGLAGTARAAVADTLPAPTGLAATAEGSSEIYLTWDDPTGMPDDVTLAGFDVYEGTSPGGESGTPINPSALIVADSDPVTDLASGTAYYFDVIAIYQAKEGGGIPSAASNEASATTASTSITAQPQTVSFPPLGSHPVGASFTVSASASSGLPVSFGTQTPSVCSVTDATVTTLTAGQCEIQASQAGDADFQPATAVLQGFTVTASTVITPTAPTSPTVPASGPGSGHTPTAAGTSGPGKTVTVLLAVAVALLAGILVLTAARLWGGRRQSAPRPPAPPATRVQAEPLPGPPPSVRIRVTGTEPTHAVRIEPHPGVRSTQIEEVRS